VNRNSSGSLNIKRKRLAVVFSAAIALDYEFLMKTHKFDIAATSAIVRLLLIQPALKRYSPR
jgi:hypothetical protein